MNALENRQLEMLARVRDFGVARAADFPVGTLGQELFATLSQVVASLETHATSQTSQRNEAKKNTTAKTAAREALRDSLGALQRTARVLALQNPGLENSFRLPRKMTDQSLLTAARAMAATAAPLVAEFIRHELPTDFLTKLNAQIAAVEVTITNRSEARSAQVTATASIGQTVEQGALLVQRVEALVRNKYGNEPQVLAAWDTARRVTRPRTAAAAAGAGAKTTVQSVADKS